MKYHAPTRTGPRRATLEQRIAILRARIAKIDQRLGVLTAKREDEAAKLLAELEMLARTNEDQS